MTLRIGSFTFTFCLLNQSNRISFSTKTGIFHPPEMEISITVNGNIAGTLLLSGLVVLILD